jgi:hypothetical protein
VCGSMTRPDIVLLLLLFLKDFRYDMRILNPPTKKFSNG